MANYKWSATETGELFVELMGDNYDRVSDLVEKTFDLGKASYDERVGYLYAWLEGFLMSDFFICNMTDEELEKVDLWEVTRMILGSEEEVFADDF